MSERLSAHLWPKGFEPEPIEFVVTPELNQQFLYAVEDFHPRYVRETESGGPFVHPGLLLSMSNLPKSPSFYLDPSVGSVHAKEKAEFLRPALVGKRLRVTWKIADVYEKRGRLYHVRAYLICDDQGNEVLRRTSIGAFISHETHGTGSA